MLGANLNKRGSLDTLSLASSKSRPSIYASTIWSVNNEALKRKLPKLNDQQWIMQRKKIGLSRKIKTPKHLKGKKKGSKVDLKTFVITNFKRKECNKYVHNSSGTETESRTAPCHCGAPRIEHVQHQQK